MSGISVRFSELAQASEGGYIPYVCAGDPSLDFSLRLIETLARAGADVIEIGIPFSDPIADGPVIQGAMQRSLAGRFETSDIFTLISDARMRGVGQPIVVMTYYNSIMQMGVERFCSELGHSGGDGILVVDLLPEDSADLDRLAAMNSLDMIRLIATNTPDGRIDDILSKSAGFTYVVSVAGTTGARSELPQSAFDTIGRIRGKSKMPLALGFGISKPEDVRAAMKAGASAAIEGSKLISIYEKKIGDEQKALEEVREHASLMKAATRGISR